MPPLRLTLAVNESDHVRDIVLGRVPVQGVELTALALPVEEIFFRFTRFREWDVSELSLAKFAHLRASGDESLVAIPAFTSRAFRHSAIFVRGDGSITQPEQLRGARIGIPEWTQTATVYARGVLAHDYGVPLAGVEWIQAGTNEPGRTEGARFTPPAGVRITAVPDRSLNDMLLDGAIDALIAAHPPTAATGAAPKIVRVFTDFVDVEEAYYRRTGVFPIMHLVAIRRDVFDAHPWVAAELLKAFEEAKRRSIARMTDPNAPFTPVPWGWARAQRAQALMGADFWPYGIEPNRRTLETFLQLAHEQGVCERLLEPEELFVDEVRSGFRI
jgi:4,5-dihydroxyphthalate decarboxylase